MTFEREWNRFLCAIQMMTRIPTPAIDAFSPDMPTRAARYYPIAGYVVGLISGGVFWITSQVGPVPIAAILAVATSAFITGAFHEDGLADAADGLGGGRTPAHRLEIMKDSRIGTYGACALFVVLALRVASVAALSPQNGAIALLASHSLARAAPVTVMRFGRYAGDPSKAKLPHAEMRVTTVELILAWTFGLIPTLLFPISTAASLACVAAAVTAIVGVRASNLIGGFTGDVLGCIEQLVEASMLVGLAWALHLR